MTLTKAAELGTSSGLRTPNLNLKLHGAGPTPTRCQWGGGPATGRRRAQAARQPRTRRLLSHSSGSSAMGRAQKTRKSERSQFAGAGTTKLQAASSGPGGRPSDSVGRPIMICRRVGLGLRSSFQCHWVTENRAGPPTAVRVRMPPPSGGEPGPRLGPGWPCRPGLSLSSPSAGNPESAELGDDCD